MLFAILFVFFQFSERLKYLAFLEFPSSVNMFSREMRLLTTTGKQIFEETGKQESLSLIWMWL